MLILVGGFGQRSSFPGWLVINCFFFSFNFFCFSSTKFSFFPFLKPWMERDAYLWVRPENPPPFCWNWNPCFVDKGSLLVKSEPSSFASSPRQKNQRASSPSFYPLFRSNRHPVVWLAHQPLVIQNEGLNPTVFENSLPPYWTACFKLKQVNMCQQVSPNDSSSRLWDRICKYNRGKVHKTNLLIIQTSI